MVRHWRRHSAAGSTSAGGLGRHRTRRTFAVTLAVALGAACVLTGVASATAAPEQTTAASAAILPPDQDPFYVPPAG